MINLGRRSRPLPAALPAITMSNAAPPYDDRIDVHNTAHIRYFANVHGLTIAPALELIRACAGDRRAADEAANAFKAHFKQSLT